MSFHCDERQIVLLKPYMLCFKGIPSSYGNREHCLKILIHILLLIIYQIDKAIYSTMHSFTYT